MGTGGGMLPKCGGKWLFILPLEIKPSSGMLFCIATNPLLRNTALKIITNTIVASLFALSGTFAIAQSTAPNDAQIAAIVVAANTVDINAGKLAEKRAEHKEVKAFAKQMVTDHTGVNKEATTLVKKLKVTPEENTTSKKLKTDGDANEANLKKLKGAEFDKAYIAHEVAYHQAVIDELDTTLIPNTKNAELKDMLIKVRPAFVAHLEHAKQIQEKLK